MSKFCNQNKNMFKTKQSNIGFLNTLRVALFWKVNSLNILNYTL